MDFTISSTTAETILVVDDCEALCELLEILLSRTGYRVLTATSGAKALQIARTISEIDLLITNVDMPATRGDFSGILPCFTPRPR
ncbi:MAG: response regulator [Chthoniobacter sp.]|nr:response regulator [Chthoniobacter sp.]